MDIPIFLSHPEPHLQRQRDFIHNLTSYLRKRGLHPRTLGATNYDTEAPLRAVRRMLIESNGVLTIAFRRLRIETGCQKWEADLPNVHPTPVSDIWLTSPWCHIEAAMAFQLGLPVLVFREKGVQADGILEQGVMGIYMPEFNLDDVDQQSFDAPMWQQLLGQWEAYVRSTAMNKGTPPKLY